MVKQNNITDKDVVNACNEYTQCITKLKRLGSPWDNKGNSLERLFVATMLPREECLEAMKAAVEKGIIDYVLIETAWPTHKGLEILKGDQNVS